MSGDESWRAVCGRPAPRFNAAALTAWLTAVGDPIEMIRMNGAPFPTNRWSEAGLSRLFGIDVSHHCFRSVPHTWTGFHEPQITGGFAHFLNSGTPSQRLSRSVAFIKAAAQAAGLPTAPYDQAHSAHAAAEENRTDLLVTLFGDGKPTGASIEAKFGHRLTPGQLPKAFRHVERRGWDLDTAVLLVVAPNVTSLPQTTKRWRSTSWWTLLSALEALLDPVHDCEDFRRFRRTVWHRAYGGR